MVTSSNILNPAMKTPPLDPAPPNSQDEAIPAIFAGILAALGVSGISLFAVEIAELLQRFDLLFFWNSPSFLPYHP